MAGTKQKTARRSTTARPTKRKTTRRPQNSKKNKDYTGNIAALVLVFALLLAIFKAGFVGVFLANGLRYFFGDLYQIAASFIVVITLYGAVYSKLPRLKKRVYLGLGLTYMGCLLWATMNLFNHLGNHTNIITTFKNLSRSDFINQATTTQLGGGIIGSGIYAASYALFANWGTVIIAVITIICGIIILFNLPFQNVMGIIFNSLGIFGHKTAQSAQKVTEVMQEKSEKMRSELAQAREAERQARMNNVLNSDPFKQDVQPTGDQAKEIPEVEIDELQKITDLQSQTKAMTSQASEQASSVPVTPKIMWSGKETVTANTEKNKTTSTEKRITPVVKVSQDDTKIVPEVSVSDNIPTMTDTVKFDDQNYQMPTTDLLNQVDKTDQSKDYEMIKEKSVILQQTLKSFNIDVTVESVALGPTVTQYEIKPAIGTRLSKITGLAPDLALALAATSVRIEAPIPGKSLVGIEVPNQQQAVVGFRDIMENMPQEATNNLAVPIGRGITGQVVVADIGKMPHLLIAGQTGSGKSVSINGIIAGLLMKNKPSELKMVMVDPKQVELSVYNDIPHLLTPVVSEPKKAARALQKVAKIMDDRYKLLATVGVRKIAEYNKMIDGYNQQNGTNYVKMPFIVVIVDEMADLMIQVKNEVEQPIIRIAQLGRAAGIHMILATQRPTVDVITGLIKANVPSRIAFAVASGMDSRTILDKNGAEQLLGHGDMLFEPSGKPSERVQGAFISDQDVTSLVDFIKKQATAEYDAQLTEEIETEVDENVEEVNNQSHDAQWDEVIQFIIREQKASTSLLQRRFGFGYNRAARIIDQLEEQGFIGPNNGSKPREVYVTDNSSGVEH